MDQNWTIATAESCTGGLVAHKITSIPGSSRYFQGSVVAYANEVKMQQLGVQASTLAEFGAVSEETVQEMVHGVVNLLHTDVGVAVSGIAGPDGGTEEKPVGTIWMAVGNKERTITKLIRGTKDRSKNMEYASVYAMNLVRQFIDGQ